MVVWVSSQAPCVLEVPRVESHTGQTLPASIYFAWGHSLSISSWMDVTPGGLKPFLLGLHIPHAYSVGCLGRRSVMLGNLSLDCASGELHGALHNVHVLFCFCFSVTRCVGLTCLWALALEFMERECRRAMAWVRLQDVTHSRGLSTITCVGRITLGQ